MITAEQCPLLLQRITDVVRSVARRVHGFKREAVSFDGVAVAQSDIGDEFTVGAFLNFQCTITSMWAKTVDGSPGPLFHVSRGRRVIAVGVSHQDMRDLFPTKRIPERLQMRRIVRTWIDHRNLILAHDCDASAFECEGTGILCQQSAYQRADSDGLSVWRVEIPVEVRFHLSSFPAFMPAALALGATSLHAERCQSEGTKTGDPLC